MNGPKDCPHTSWMMIHSGGLHNGIVPGCKDCGAVGVFFPVWPDKVQATLQLSPDYLEMTHRYIERKQQELKDKKE